MKTGSSFLSNCKINLFLFVTGKRDDGYHNIFTLFYPVSLCDTINITKSNELRLTCTDTSIPTDDKNIIIQTDNILRKHYGLKDLFHIELIKNIPHGAGLGGGSSNAAVYLKAVNEISNLGLTFNDMKSIMASLGSDTVFFLKNESAVAKDRGIELYPAPILPKLYFILINPNIYISTKDIYNHKDLEYTDIENIPTLKEKYSFQELISLMHNDMQKPVINMHKEVKYLIDYLKSETIGIPLMSGSGSTVFCMFNNEQDRDFYFTKIKEKFSVYFIEKAQYLHNIK